MSKSGVELLDDDIDLADSEERIWEGDTTKIRALHARRRLEMKLEEKQLLKEIQEFDFEFSY